MIEVATHVFVPIAGAVLTEWGAEVIKVEDPKTGDPYRGLVTAGLHKLHDGVDPYFHYANRGKRSVGIDLKSAEGRDVLSTVVASADVFLTNLRVDARRRLRIDVFDRGNCEQAGALFRMDERGAPNGSSRLCTWREELAKAGYCGPVATRFQIQRSRRAVTGPCPEGRDQGSDR